MMLKNSVAGALVAATLASATPLQPKPSVQDRSISKRWEEGVDCTSDTVSNDQEGLFFAVDSSGINVYCEDIDDVSSDQGVTCYRSNSDSGSLGDIVKCPGDPAPAKNPDGTDVPEDIAGGVIKAYCGTAGSPSLPVVFANTIGCLMYGYYEANGDPVKEAEAGASAVCDTIFFGACNYFINVAPDIAEGMSRPCVDDPGSNACAFAGPSK